jgi:hypothetical protein
VRRAKHASQRELARAALTVRITKADPFTGYCRHGTRGRSARLASRYRYARRSGADGLLAVIATFLIAARLLASPRAGFVAAVVLMTCKIPPGLAPNRHRYDTHRVRGVVVVFVLVALDRIAKTLPGFCPRWGSTSALARLHDQRPAAGGGFPLFR